MEELEGEVLSSFPYMTDDLDTDSYNLDKYKSSLWPEFEDELNRLRDKAYELDTASDADEIAARIDSLKRQVEERISERQQELSNISKKIEEAAIDDQQRNTDERPDELNNEEEAPMQRRPEQAESKPEPIEPEQQQYSLEEIQQLIKEDKEHTARHREYFDLLTQEMNKARDATPKGWESEEYIKAENARKDLSELFTKTVFKPHSKDEQVKSKSLHERNFSKERTEMDAIIAKYSKPKESKRQRAKRIKDEILQAKKEEKEQQKSSTISQSQPDTQAAQAVQYEPTSQQHKEDIKTLDEEIPVLTEQKINAIKDNVAQYKEELEEIESDLKKNISPEDKDKLNKKRDRYTTNLTRLEERLSQLETEQSEQSEQTQQAQQPEQTKEQQHNTLQQTETPQQYQEEKIRAEVNQMTDVAEIRRVLDWCEKMGNRLTANDIRTKNIYIERLAELRLTSPSSGPKHAQARPDGLSLNGQAQPQDQPISGSVRTSISGQTTINIQQSHFSAMRPSQSTSHSSPSISQQTQSQGQTSPNEGFEVDVEMDNGQQQPRTARPQPKQQQQQEEPSHQAPQPQSEPIEQVGQNSPSRDFAINIEKPLPRPTAQPASPQTPRTKPKHTQQQPKPTPTKGTTSRAGAKPSGTEDNNEFDYSPSQPDDISSGIEAHSKDLYANDPTASINDIPTPPPLPKGARNTSPPPLPRDAKSDGAPARQSASPSTKATSQSASVQPPPLPKGTRRVEPPPLPASVKNSGSPPIQSAPPVLPTVPQQSKPTPIPPPLPQGVQSVSPPPLPSGIKSSNGMPPIQDAPPPLPRSGTAPSYSSPSRPSSSSPASPSPSTKSRGVSQSGTSQSGGTPTPPPLPKGVQSVTPPPLPSGVKSSSAPPIQSAPPVQSTPSASGNKSDSAIDPAFREYLMDQMTGGGQVNAPVEEQQPQQDELGSGDNIANTGHEQYMIGGADNGQKDGANNTQNNNSNSGGTQSDSNDKGGMATNNMNPAFADYIKDQLIDHGGTGGVAPMSGLNEGEYDAYDQSNQYSAPGHERYMIGGGDDDEEENKKDSLAGKAGKAAGNKLGEAAGNALGGPIGGAIGGQLGEMAGEALGDSAADMAQNVAGGNAGGAPSGGGVMGGIKNVFDIGRRAMAKGKGGQKLPKFNVAFIAKYYPKIRNNSKLKGQFDQLNKSVFQGLGYLSAYFDKLLAILKPKYLIPTLALDAIVEVLFIDEGLTGSLLYGLRDTLDQVLGMPGIEQIGQKIVQAASTAGLI